jgi:tetratricopeptide (TPR) repeat protein
MPDLIDDLSQRWKSNPDAKSTIALCEALRSVPRPTLVQQVGELAQKKHASDVPVLVAVARMYMDTQRLPDAQAVLVSAGKLAPREGNIYRWLGEVLLRRGDADRAEKVLERAKQLGATDPGTGPWLERARALKPIQAKAGERAVAAEAAKAPSDNAPPARAKVDSYGDDAPTFQKPPLAERRSEDGDDEATRIKVERPKAPNRPDPATVPLATPTHEIRQALDESLKNYGNGAPPTPYPDPHDRSMAPPTPYPQEHAAAEAPRAESRVGPPAAPFSAAPPAPASGRNLPPLLPTREPPRAPVPERIEVRAGKPASGDVLKALALAGVFDPPREGATGPVWDRPIVKERRRSALLLGVAMVLLVGSATGTYTFVQNRRAKEHAIAEAILQKVEDDTHASQASLLPGMEEQIGKAFDLDSRSPRAALDWLRERALLGLLKGGADVAFEDGMSRATEVGVQEDKIAFARIASFLFQGDTAGAAALMPKWDGPAQADAWYQLMTGETLERAGDPRATERYAAAVKADPSLMVAQVALVRQTALEGDARRAGDLAKEFHAKYGDRAEGLALVSLAWARDPARGEQPPPEVEAMRAHEAELPQSLKAVPPAIAAIQDVDKHAYDDAKQEIEKGLAAVDGPGVASWLGSIALDTGDEGLARKAALAAVGFSAVYAPARVLAARVALLGDRLDEALKAADELETSSPDVAVVRAAVAYERVDSDGIDRALEAVPAEARQVPFLSALTLAASVLLGKAAMPAAKIFETSNDEAPWSSIVAMDLAMDVGELDVADKIAQSWKGSETNPLHALRLSRLYRYQNKLDLADAMSKTALDAGTVTTRTLEERVFVLVAKNRGAEVGPLLAKFPVLQANAAWLRAYALASAGKVEEARGKTASLDPPPVLAPLPTRIIAAVALGAMKDKKRGGDVVKGILDQGIQDPDLLAAAASLGVKKAPPPRRR